MIKNPCYNCEHRKFNCHSDCPKDKDPNKMGYQDWKKKNDERKKAKYREDEYNGYISNLRNAEKKEWKK